jgi:hypothetical protein
MPIEKVLVDIFGNIKLGTVWTARGCPRKQFKLRRHTLRGKQRHLAKRLAIMPSNSSFRSPVLILMAEIIEATL